MSTPARLRTVGLIAGREVNARLRTRSFVVGTAAILTVLSVFLILQATVLSDAGAARVGLSGQATALGPTIEAAAQEAGTRVVTTVVPGEREARAAVAAGRLDAVVSGSAAELQVLVAATVDTGLRRALTEISRHELLVAKLAEAGVPDPMAVLAEADAVTVAVVTLGGDDPARGERQAIGLLTVALLFLSISTYGGLVAQGVIEEKASRVVEILLAAVSPWQLLLGKVVGLGLVGLVQLLVIATAALLTAAVAGVLTVTAAAVGALLWAIVWFLLGFFLYATVFAGVGSLVSRQEDAPTVLAPVTVTLLLGFVVGLNLMIADPDGTATTVLSLVPLFSPILMPGRIAVGAASGWEVAAALAMTAATVAGGVWLAGRVYRNAVLRTGSRIRLGDALRS